MSLRAMDFGLRFNSHQYPLEKRTSVTFGNSPIEFNDEMKLGFHFNFYAQPMFGTLVSVTLDNGDVVSVVASNQGNDVYMLGLVVNDKMKLMNGLISVDTAHESKIDLSINKRRKAAIFSYDNNEIELPMDLSKANNATVVFGIDKKNSFTDAAPIEVRNVRFFIDNKNTNCWDFKYHDSQTCRIDEISGVKAHVSNPHWLIDDHTDWHLLYSETVKGLRQTAFDPIAECFYIVDNDKIKVWHPLKGDSSEYGVNGGSRVMAYSNHMVYDTITNSLVNYNLSKGCISRFNKEDGIWRFNSEINPNDEANYANHAFAIDGDVAYAFGGYGFYKYHNDLFKINLSTGSIEECKLQPELSPATSAAAAVLGDKLYIFGGKGNSSGRQELPAKYQYALYAYDRNTWKGELVWELDSVPYDFLPSQTMYYDALEDSFYAASTCHGGELIKISRTKPEVKTISTAIKSKMEYHDIVFDLFRSRDEQRYYLLIDKRLDPTTHEYSIYTISAPFLDNPEIINNKSTGVPVEESGFRLNWWLVIGVAIVACAVILFVVAGRKRRRAKLSEIPVVDKAEPNMANDSADDVADDASDIAVNDAESLLVKEALSGVSDGSDSAVAQEDEELLFFDKRSNYILESKFDRSKSAISLLGAFNVRDKNGDDITNKFTDRLKSLLILLLLSNDKSKNGIKYQAIDEEIWGDKDEKSAQNNRNVYMRKLRLLLEEVGNVPITYDKGYFKIDCSNVTYDYGEAVSRIEEIQMNGNASSELINETLDLLLMGPLLPMTTYEWLDQYKGDYSSRALEILNKLLKYEFSRDEELSFKIAQTISCHEALSEEAMKAKCILLSRKKMVGQAKRVYAKFCREYKQSLGEDYPCSLPDVCKSKI